jgi:hypothetical protein
MSKPQNWSVPGCPWQRTQPVSVLDTRVGAVLQVVVLEGSEDVELGMTEELIFADVVIVERVDAEVNVALALKLKLELGTLAETLKLLELAEMLKLLELTESDELLDSLAIEIDELLDKLLDELPKVGPTTTDETDVAGVDFVEDTTGERVGLAQPLICFAPQMDASFFVAPSFDLR